MNEKVKMLYEKYGKLNLNINEMSKEIGISSSKASKIFSETGEKEIIKRRLLPRWRKIGNTRLWSIESVIDWNFGTEKIA